MLIPTLHIHLLGEFRLVSGETPVTSIDMPRLQSLLAYLLLHRSTPQGRSHLAFALWPDSTDAQAHTNLRNLVHRLRQTLPHADTFLHSTRQELQWQPASPEAHWTLDVLDFERACALAGQAERDKDLAAARQALIKAVNLYRGDLLPNCYDEWILPERDRLRQAFLGALKQLIALLEGERNYPVAIKAAQRLLRHDPLDEDTYRRLMHLYAVSGDRAAALRTYHTCVTVLERELATEPDRATREIYERLLHTEVPPTEQKVSSPALAAVAPFVGRQPEWEQLQTAWRSASAGRPYLVVLSGEVGIGKTRLAEELLSWVSRQGLATAIARCYAAAGGLAYAPVAAWLRADALQTSLSTLPTTWLTEVARLVPDLLVQRPDLPHPGPLVEGWQRQHLFEALARATLASRQPLLLLLDDLQWCDQETLEWLHYLLRFDPQAPLLLVGTLRSEEMTNEHLLASFLVSLRREGVVVEIELGPLDVLDTSSLATQVAGRQLDPTMAVNLYHETEGNPLFVVETVRAGTLEAQGAEGHTIEDKTNHSMLPPTVQAVITARLAQLSPAAREVTSVAAVIGRAFTFAVLARASGREEDALVEELDELWQKRIIRQQGAGTSDAYDFSHDKLREGAYMALSSARRRLLHRRAAEALEALHASNLDTVSGQLAAHYEHAGLLQQAISYYRRAGEVARQVYANTEALTYFQRALALLERIVPGASQQQWLREMTAQFHEQVGDTFELTGQYEEMRKAYQHALNHVPTHKQIWQARLHRKVAKSWETYRRYEEALRAYRMAESTLDGEPTGSDPEWWQEWIEIQDGKIVVHYWLAQVREMAELIGKTWVAVEQYGTEAQRAAFCLSLTGINLRRDRYMVSEETLRYARIALAAYQKSGNLIKIGWAQYNLGFYYLWLGDLDEAEAQMQAALAMAEQTGDVMAQSHCLTFLAIAKRKRGQVEETRRSSERSLQMATATQRPEYIGTARANLAWVAWRAGKLSEAQVLGRAALELWQQTPLVYPFQWTALCPLIGVALAQDQLSEAIAYARALLTPEQQRLPGSLATPLEAALHAWDSDQPDVARTQLQQATAPAQELGYL